MHSRGQIRDAAALETHTVTDCVQNFPWSFDLVSTPLKATDRHMVDFIFSVVKHSLLLKVFCVDPLQWDPCRRNIVGCLQVFTALDFELEATSHITCRVYLYADIRICMRPNKVRPVIFEGRSVPDQQLHHKSSSRACQRYCRFGTWRYGSIHNGQRRIKGSKRRWERLIFARCSLEALKWSPMCGRLRMPPRNISLDYIATPGPSQ